ncbi:BLOC-2 complex member HPS3-like [Ptychodera flava]|uniref:BLOC-2 complex member HPS3-like n=1 Tax=Ptychodera flava TaxID=63121 RepID=UPI00396A116E
MVRVFSCHHFVSQQVFTTKSEPIALCCVGDQLLVSTDQCNIEIYALSHSEKSCQLSHSFNTVALAHQILHNGKGNYIATLEVKTTRHNTVTFVRIYMNWATCSNQHPVRARVAGCNVRWTEMNTSTLEVMEILIKETVTHISSCDKTGNLVVAVGKCVKLYYHCMKTLGNTDLRYNDFEPALSIEMGFNLLEVAVCGDYLAGISVDQIRVVRLVWSRKRPSLVSEGAVGGVSGSRRSVSRYSSLEDDMQTISPITDERDHQDGASTPMDEELQTEKAPLPWQSQAFYEAFTDEESQRFHVEDDHYVLWNFNASVHSTDENIISPLSVVQETVTDNKDEVAIEVLGPVESVAGNPITVEWIGKYKSSAPIATSTLLYRHCTFPGDSTGQHLHSLKLLPTYQKDSQTDKLCGLCCFVSGFHEGFMYDVISSHCIQLSTYNYTAKTRHVGVTNSLLHAVTSNGLETYTISKMAAALWQLEEPSEKWAIPSSTSDISLIGFQAFYDIRAVSAAESYVVMLSKAIESPTAKSWSIYVLQKPTSIELYREMLDLASKYRLSNPTAYQQILIEAYLLIKSALYKAEDKSCVAILEELVKESCALLGDHYARISGEDHRLAISYYAMSELTLSDIINRHRDEITSQDSYFKYEGLLVYLNSVLFQEKVPRPDIDQATGDVILEIYSKYQPGKLSEVIVNSKVIKFTDEKALSLLQSHRKGHEYSTSADLSYSLDCLATSILYLQICDLEAALAVVSSMSKDSIITSCTKHYHLLLDESDSSHLSHIAQLLRRHRPDVLIEALVHLHDNGTVDMDKALTLLDVSIGDDQNNIELSRENIHVRDYLEALLNSANRKHIFPKALRLLIEIYMTRLKRQSKEQSGGSARPIPHSHIPRGNGHFVPRHTWLDQLPPFRGSRSLVQQCELYRTQSFGRSTSPQAFVKSSPSHGLRPSSPQTIRFSPTRDPNEPCPCCCCNEDLLKLQSLLCWKLASQETRQQVIASLDKTIHGHLSLEILCQSKLDTAIASEIIVDNYPHLTVDYAHTQFLQQCDDWVALFQMVLAKVSHEESRMTVETDVHSVYIEALKGVLSEVVEFLDPVSLLSLLPSTGSCRFFLPYIERCHQKHKAEQLKNKVFEQVCL